MSTRTYRLTVLGCALCWFMAGLHLPALHAMTHHESSPPWTVLTLMTLFVAGAVVALWVLLRVRVPRPAGESATAT
jgi:peptidoglycan/LPS O-acetylase OafA/YrhL